MSTVFFRGLLSRRDFLTTTATSVFKLSSCLHRFSTQPKVLLNMNEAIVHFEKGNNVFDISFRFVHPDVNLDRQFNFSRQSSETVNSFLRRIDVNISKFVTKKLKRKKKQNSAEEEPQLEDNVVNEKIKIIRNNVKIDGDVSCESILENASELKLVIFDTEYEVKLNTPCITSISLPSSILAGFPTYPSKFESTHTDREKSIFTWYKLDILSKPLRWIQVGEGYLYIPSESDIGCKLKLICLPKNDTQTGPAIEVLSKELVHAGPGPCPFETRHAFTKNRLSGKSFRVMSYNILADTYADSDYSREVLFPYCPTYALDMDYRKQLILKEVLGFNADIMCLQEVDSKVYERDLVPSLSTLSYNSVYNTKNDLREGLAVFYNSKRFSKLNSTHSVISQGIDSTEFKTVWSQIQNENVKTRFVNRSTVVQATTVRSTENPSEILIIGNTHLYFHPNADHIRLLQAYYIVTYLRKIAQETKEQNPECNVSILLCGDFNSVPECGIYQLVTKNYVPESSDDWRSYSEEVVENVSLRHDLHFSSACGTPEYTNYTPNFSACLDYIFYQTDHLEVEQVIPMPSKEELMVHDGLPSVVFPSDHISLCADLKWSK